MGRFVYFHLFLEDIFVIFFIKLHLWKKKTLIVDAGSSWEVRHKRKEYLGPGWPRTVQYLCTSTWLEDLTTVVTVGNEIWDKKNKCEADIKLSQEPFLYVVWTYTSYIFLVVHGCFYLNWSGALGWCTAPNSAVTNPLPSVRASNTIDTIQVSSISFQIKLFLSFLFKKKMD